MALTSPGAADVKVGGNTVAKWRFDLIKDESRRSASWPIRPRRRAARFA